MIMSNYSFLFCLILLQIIKLSLCAPPAVDDTIFGINLANLQQDYLRVLFDDELSYGDRGHLYLVLNAIQVHLVIEKSLAELADNFEGKGTDLLVKKYGKMRGPVGPSFVCKLWNFAEMLESLKNIFGRQQEDQLDTVQTHSEPWRYLFFVPPSNDQFCEFLDVPNFPENPEEQPAWAWVFFKFVSELNLKYFRGLLEAENGKDFDRWFGFAEGLAEGSSASVIENELVTKLRRVGTADEFVALRRMKRWMTPALLNREDMAELEMSHPMFLGIDVIEESMSQELLRELFESSLESDKMVISQLRLEVSIWYAKVWTFFTGAEEQSARDKEKLRELWPELQELLDKLPELHKDPYGFEQDTLGRLHDYLGKLQNELLGEGKDRMYSARRHALMMKIPRMVAVMYESDPEFRTMFQENKESREKLRKLIEFGTEHDQDQDQQRIFLVPDNFWNLFKEKITIRFIPKSYDQCPNKNMTIADLKTTDSDEMSKDTDAYLLMSFYLKLLKSVDNPESLNTGSMMEIRKKTEVLSIIWYYKETIRVLFEFADSIEDKSDKFKDFMDILSPRDFGQMLQDSEQQFTKLCEVYLFAQNLTRIRTFNRNEKWKNHVEKLMGSNLSMLFDEHLILIEGWDSVDYSDVEVAKKLLQKFYDDPLKMQRIQFFALKQLTKRFKQLQHLFCHGIPTVADVVTVKERLRWLVGERVLDALDSSFPEIMHYEHLDIGIHRLTFLTQMMYKTGQVMGECYEARIGIPPILRKILKFEQKIAENGYNLPLEMCQNLLKKIVQMKEEVYPNLGRSLEYYRKALCQFWNLEKWIEHIVKKPQNALVEIDCSIERNIKKVLFAYRIERKNENFAFLEISLGVGKEFGEKLITIPGIKSRIKKFLNLPAMFVELVKKDKTLADMEVSTNEKLLQSHYTEALFSPADQTLKRQEGELKADAIAFIRWMDQRFAMPAPDIAILVRRLDNVWTSEMRKIHLNLYDQLSDETDLRELETLGHQMSKVYATSKEFVGKVMERKKLKTEKIIGKEWKKLVNQRLEEFWKDKLNEKDGEEGQEQDGETDDQAELNRKFREWMGELHYQTLKKLVKKEDQQNFREELRKGFAVPETVERLFNLLNNTDKGLEILQIMGLEESYKGKEEQQQSPNDVKIDKGKRAKKKRKAKKSQNNKEEEIGEGSGQVDEGVTEAEGDINDRKEEIEEKVDEKKERTGERSHIDEEVTEAEGDVHDRKEGIEEEMVDKKEGNGEEEDIYGKEIKENKNNGQENNKLMEVINKKILLEKADDKKRITEGDKNDREEVKVEEKEEEEGEERKVRTIHIEEEMEGSKGKETNQNETRKEELGKDKEPNDKQNDNNAKAVEGSSDSYTDQTNTYSEDSGQVSNKHKDNGHSKEIDSIEKEQKPNRITSIDSSSKGNIFREKEQMEIQTNKWVKTEVGDEMGLMSSPKVNSSKISDPERISGKNIFDPSEPEETDLDYNEIEGIRVGYFAEDSFLSLKYGELVGILTMYNFTNNMTKRRSAFLDLMENEEEETEEAETDQKAKTLIKLLDIGICANEIGHRLEGIKDQMDHMEGIKDQIAQLKDFRREWESIGQIKLSRETRWTELERNLYELLKRITETMEKTGKGEIHGDKEVRDSVKKGERQTAREMNEMKTQLHLKKLAISFGNLYGIWKILTKAQQKMIISKIFGKENCDQQTNIFEQLEAKLEERK